MRIHNALRVGLYIVASGSFWYPACAFADTIIADLEISEDTTWTKAGSPYLISNWLTVAPNATLSIGPGVVVRFNSGWVEVLGILRAAGTADEPITFDSVDKSSWYGIEFWNQESASSLDHVIIRHASTAISDYSSKDLSVSHARIEHSYSIIEGFGSRIAVNALRAEDISGDAIGLYDESDVVLADVAIKDIMEGIRMYGKSQADVAGLVIDRIFKGDAIGLYEQSRLTIRDSSLSNGSSDGIGVYMGSSVDLRSMVISGFAHGAGVSDYSIRYPTSAVSISGSEITGNGTGIASYADNSLYAISSNSIHGNLSFGLESYGSQAVDIRGNFWGDPSGPYHPDNYEGMGDVIYDLPNNPVVFSPWLTSDPFADQCANGGCSSNVLFLPGIQGSRLYEGTGCGKKAEEKLWEPMDGSLWQVIANAGDKHVKSLRLNQSGVSLCGDIYAKTDDVIDSAGGDIYKSFIEQMNGLKADGTIADWKAATYDWRLSLPDLLNKGAERSGKLYFGEATSTPYIEQTLRSLAASSKTGKVTIVSHSNGGLITKALLKKLGDAESARLVDKIIMAGAPQSGAPAAVGASLVGYGAGIYTDFYRWNGAIRVVSNAASRALAQNAPMTYHLLPSQEYIKSTLSDLSHPVARFSGEAYAKEREAYGSLISSKSALDDFLLAKEGGREKPKEKDVASAEILNTSLISYGNSQHAALDSWSPPGGIETYQIAGWGADTVAGIEFYTAPKSRFNFFGSRREYRPIFVEDGDGTVPVPSALLMASSSSVRRYWLNLANSSIRHANILENSDLNMFLKRTLTNGTSSLPLSFSNKRPIRLNPKKLIFYLHSTPLAKTPSVPLLEEPPVKVSVKIKDAVGKVTGVRENDSVSEVAEEIPGSTYGEFGDVPYIIVPEGKKYEITIQGRPATQNSGEIWPGNHGSTPAALFSLDIQEVSGSEIITTTTIANVPATASTTATIAISGGIGTASPLSVDQNGDGKTDISVPIKPNETVAPDTQPSVPDMLALLKQHISDVGALALRNRLVVLHRQAERYARDIRRAKQTLGEMEKLLRGQRGRMLTASSTDAMLDLIKDLKNPR